MKNLSVCVALLATAVGFAQQPSINLYVSRNVAPGPKVRLQITTASVPVVRMEIFRIDPVEWLTRPPESKQHSVPIGAAVQSWNISVEDPDRNNRQSQQVYRQRQINLPSLKPGMYLLIGKGPKCEGRAVVNVTNLGLVVKQSPHRCLAWVTDFRTGNVLSAVRVSLYDTHRRLIKSGITAGDGTLLLETNPGEFRVVANRGADYAGFASAGPEIDGVLAAYLQTDRPIYRPGQRVFVKAILRRTLGQGYKVLAGKAASVELRDTNNLVVDRVAVTSNDMGSLSCEFTLPEEAIGGSYSVVLTTGKESAYTSISCASYRKPEYKVEAKPVQKRYLAGEVVRFSLDANYYFGSPVPQAEVRYTVRSNSLEYWSRSMVDGAFYGGDGNLYPRDEFNGNAYAASDVVHTDDLGHVTIAVPSPAKSADCTFELSATVTDGSGRQITTSTSVPVYRARVRVAVRPLLSYVPLGELMPVEVSTSDLDGNAVASRVSLVLVQDRWDEKTEKFVRIRLTSFEVRVGAKGTVLTKVPGLRGGDVELDASTSDGTGRTAIARAGFFVADSFAKTDVRVVQPEVKLRLDRRSFSIGDSVHSYAETSAPGRPILMVLEGREIWAYRVSPKAAKGFSWTTSLTGEMTPNAYLTASQWSKNGLLTSVKTVPIPDLRRQIHVEVTPEHRVFEPGQLARYSVRTTDAHGNAVPAEVGVVVVDEAIYGLQADSTPDIYGHYWGLRPNRVATFEAMPTEVSGGAYQRVPGGNPVAVRERFEDTALWKAVVQTDAAGKGTFSYEVPGNLTQWRATARAIDDKTSAGTGVSTVAATRAVTLRLAVPRQFVKGDSLDLVGTVNNRSTKPRAFDVSLAATGLEILGAEKQHVFVAANSESRVVWRVVAVDLSTVPATLTGRVAVADSPSDERFADALRVSVPIVPPGLAELVRVSASLAREGHVIVNLPPDRIEPATRLKVRVWAGVQAAANEATQQVLDSYSYGSQSAASKLLLAPAKNSINRDDRIIHALRRVQADMTYSGWPIWTNGPMEPLTTADVAFALGIFSRNQGPLEPHFIDQAFSCVVAQFNNTALWEYRARLVAAALVLKPKEGLPLADQVIRNLATVSPFSKLRLAEGLLSAGSAAQAKRCLLKAESLISDGPNEAYLPVGTGVGWTASSTETTAQLLIVLSQLDVDPLPQGRLVQWLLRDDLDWRSTADTAAVARGLGAYLQKHPGVERIGNAVLLVNGHAVALQAEKVGAARSAEVPREYLLSGSNVIDVTRDDSSAAFISVSGTVFRPLDNENTFGLRVVRRFEHKNAAGVWEELTGTVRQNEPVRVTLAIWGDSVRDAIKVTEPIPSGFELVSSESYGGVGEEVRDGAITHYLMSDGDPQHVRYYLRAESEGVLRALPVSATVIRRPSAKGRSSGLEITVVKGRQ